MEYKQVTAVSKKEAADTNSQLHPRLLSHRREHNNFSWNTGMLAQGCNHIDEMVLARQKVDCQRV